MSVLLVDSSWGLSPNVSIIRDIILVLGAASVQCYPCLATGFFRADHCINASHRTLMTRFLSTLVFILRLQQMFEIIVDMQR